MKTIIDCSTSQVTEEALTAEERASFEASRPSLDQLKKEAKAQIDQAAAPVRSRFTTQIPGQDAVYVSKRRVAEMYLADPSPDDSSPTYIALATEAPAWEHKLGYIPTLIQLATIWLQVAEQTEAALAQIEQIRLRGKFKVEAATDAAGVQAALQEALDAYGKI